MISNYTEKTIHKEHWNCTRHRVASSLSRNLFNENGSSIRILVLLCVKDTLKSIFAISWHIHEITFIRKIRKFRWQLNTLCNLPDYKYDTFWNFFFLLLIKIKQLCMHVRIHYYKNSYKRSKHNHITKFHTT